MEPQIKAIHDEGLEFVKLKKENDNLRWPDAGTPSYIISVSWLDAYKEYVFYTACSMGRPPDPSEGHCTEKHPGKIANLDILEQDAKFVKGTGTIKDFPSEVYDTFLKRKVREGSDYEFITEELWVFLKQRYGVDQEIKRFYTKSSGKYIMLSSSTTVESRFSVVPIFLVKGEDLLEGKVTTIDLKYTQMSRAHTYSNFKKRIVDILVAQGMTGVKQEEVRMWLSTAPDKLEASIKAIAQSKGGMEVDEESKTDGKPIIAFNLFSIGAEVEVNSGVEFPGESVEPYVGTSLNFADREFSEEECIVIEIGTTKFAYKYQEQERIHIGECEFCTQRNALKVVCKCKRVRYCNENCRQRDERFHLPSCADRIGKQIGEVKMQKRDPNANDGKVGLSNLGNTCFMNSSLQCLSLTYELTSFFLESRYAFVAELQKSGKSNPLGTDGRLVMAYAKLINEMWNDNSRCVAPQLFKRILGEYNPTFAGYGQQDSHECINTILDLLGEDLYRKGKKPYVEQDEVEGQPAEEAAKEAWHKHLLRNESIITDLFHGQYKSTVNCNQCDRVSVTFDPMMTILLPIPAQKKAFEPFVFPFDFAEGNKFFRSHHRGTDSLREFRQVAEEKFKIPKGSYVSARVAHNSIEALHCSATTLDETTGSGYGAGEHILYQIDPDLKPSLPDQDLENDGLYNISDEYTMCVVDFKLVKPMAYGN